MRTEKGKIIKKLLISFILIMGFIFALSLYNNQTLAATKFPGGKGKEKENMKKNVSVNQQYIFDTQTLWENPYIFCVQPQYLLHNNSNGTIEKEYYINSKTGVRKNVNSKDDLLMATIYAAINENPENLSGEESYGEYLKKSAWQHIIWIAKYGERNKIGEYVPKNSDKLEKMKIKGELYYVTNTVSEVLPWTNIVRNGVDRAAWHYYDPITREDEGLQSGLELKVKLGYEIILNMGYVNEDIYTNKNIRIEDNSAKVTYDSSKTELSSYKEYIIVGPFEIKDTRKSDEIKNISIEYKKNGKTVKKSELSTNNDIKFVFQNYIFDDNLNITGKEWKDGYPASMTDTTGKFYIVINKNAGITSIDNVNIKFKRRQIEAKWWDIRIDAGQNLVYGWGKFTEENIDVKVDVPNLIPPVQVELDKVDTAGAAVSGAKFSIEYSNGLKGETKTVGTDGKIKFSQVQPTSPDSFTATIKETSTPSGYKMLEKPIELKFTYDSNNAVWKVEKTSGPDEKVTIGTVTKDNKSGTVKIPITVENKSIIEKLTLLKTSSVSGGKVEKAKFKLTLTNVASIKNHQIPEAGEVTIIETTKSDGNLVLEDIEIKDLNEPVVITIEEIEAPVGYKKIEGTITVTLKREGNGYKISETVKDTTVTDDEFKAGKVELKNHELELNIKDIPVMNLGGIVWTEKIQTDKATAEINNQYDGENQDEALAGIKVTLYKDGKKVTETTSSDGNQKATYTDHKGNKIEVDLAKGEYMFTDITAGDDYYVVFEYDGIKYQAMTNSKEQAYTTKARDTKIAEEPNRKDFNDNTKTISPIPGKKKENENKSITNTGWIIEYDLDNNSTPNKAIYKNIKNENGELQYVEGKTYTYLSKTEDWMGTWNTDGTINKSHYAFNINCGLSKKLFDLSLGTDVKDATVTINGNQTTYTYDQILDGKLDEALNRPSSEKNIDYNLYLAVSDYNYRIADYKVPGEGAIENKYDAEALSKGQIESAKKDSELEVYVTYRIELKNQSAQHDAKVNLVEYHFDEHYQYVSIKNATAEKDPNARVLYITPDEGIEAGRTLLPNIEITFKVLPDENGNKCVLGEDYLNQAEIVSYTTGGGLVDEDSAPGNAFLDQNNVRYEDDTDEANGIQIKLKTNAERSISGKVFDTENNNNSVNDVIVQLIELVEIENKQQYEYIWQETVAGSNTVKTTDRNGYSGKSYSFTDDNNKNKAGEYKFTQGIIPGNYIVRFIYGDGSTYDITGNTLTYNGEDYKSTYVDYDYNAPWYNNTSLDGENSKAVDNEARRLRVMSYAVDVNGNKGKTLNALDNITDADKQNEIITAYKKLNNLENENITFEDVQKAVLKNTWMCAETLKIKMPVDTDIKDNTSDTTEVGEGSSPIISNTQFDNVNLGLMERPKTKLVLEKYITGLTVRPVASGVNLIANATADINKIIDKDAGAAIELEGQKDGLFATKSGRENRGLWYLQTDTTELAQGADAFITYTYVIRNDGEQDYLSAGLIKAYEENKGTIDNILYNSYQEYLVGLEKHVKGKIKSKGEYLSGSYYRKNDNAFTPTPVKASVEQIQEALNPKVKFVNSTTDFSIIKDTSGNTLIENKKVYKEDGSNTLENEKIKEQITSTTGTEKMQLKGVNTSKKLVVSVGLSASEIENGGVYDSYIAQVTRYTNAAGRRDQSTPDNLSYVHSYDAGKTLEDNNEEDEFWAERFTITKPTGEDKITPVQIAIITISAVAVLGVGIILIKKFVLKK